MATLSTPRVGAVCKKIGVTALTIADKTETCREPVRCRQMKYTMTVVVAKMMFRTTLPVRARLPKRAAAEII